MAVRETFYGIRLEVSDIKSRIAVCILSLVVAVLSLALRVYPTNQDSAQNNDQTYSENSSDI